MKSWANECNTGTESIRIIALDVAVVTGGVTSVLQVCVALLQVHGLITGVHGLVTGVHGLDYRYAWP